MRRQAVRGKDVLDRRADLDLARELLRLGAVRVADDLVATAPTVRGPGRSSGEMRAAMSSK